MRTLRFLRRLAGRPDRCALVGLSDFVLSLEVAGLIVVHWRRHGAGRVQITSLGLGQLPKGSTKVVRPGDR